MSIRSPEDRAVLRRAAEIRKADRKARPAKVQPIAAGQRQPRKHDKPYLAWIRNLPCVACVADHLTHTTDGRPVASLRRDAAHLRYSDGARRNPGMGAKPDDRFALPLCRSHHRDQHRGSERQFWENRHIDPGLLCHALSEAYDADQDGSAVIRQFTRHTR